MAAKDKQSDAAAKAEEPKAERPNVAKPQPHKGLSKSDKLAIALKLRRDRGRIAGFARRAQIPQAETVSLSVVAHDRCKRRGIKVFSQHFTCDEAIELSVAELPPGIANKICRHPELIVQEFNKQGDCLTPERPQPPTPKKRRAAEGGPAESPAGPASKKRRGIQDPQRTSNHPRPAAPIPAAPKGSKSRKAQDEK
jgi:hypothetical protein